MLVGYIIHSFNGGMPWTIKHKDDPEEDSRLDIERAGERLEVVLPYLEACTKPATFSPGGSLSTFRHPAGVTVTRGLLDFVSSNDQLAILIAHEMAHQLLDDEYARISKYTEERADRFSLDLALRAGYDIRQAAEIWERLAVQRPWMITTEPDFENRRSKQVHHGYVAARTLFMPEIIAELLSEAPLK